jgi:AraC family transcriptional regulator
LNTEVPANFILMTTISNKTKYEYIYRVNRAIDYIWAHAVENLDLGKIAKEACLSKYHFHRIFHNQMGETVNEFVRRQRLEFAFFKLGVEENKSITEIALECGFSSSQNFTKAFKKHFDVSPKFVRGEYNWYKMRGIGGPVNKLSEKEDLPRTIYCSDTGHEWINSLTKKVREQKRPMRVNVVEMPSFHLAYIRIIGHDHEKHRQARKKISLWAKERGLLNENSLLIGVLNSDGFVTTPEKFSYDICLTIPRKYININERLNIRDIPGGKYAVYHCETDKHDTEEEWVRLFIDWLPSSGYKIDTRHAYQIYCNDYDEHPLKHMIADLCIPIKLI